MAVGKFNTIGFSPFGVDGGRPIPSDLAATYEMLNNMAPMILAHQGTGTMTAVRMVDGDPPKQVKLGNYTLTFSYTGRSMRLAPQAKGGVVASPPPPQPGAQPEQSLPPLEAAAVVISTGPDEYYFGGDGMRVDFTPNTPGPPNVGLGVVQTSKFVDGKWELTRWIEGDDDAQGEILVLNPGTIVRVQLYRAP